MPAAEISPWCEPSDDVQFGDVFEAPWLLDLYVRDDAALIGGAELAAHLVPKMGKWMNVELPAEPMGVYSRAFTPRSEDRYALGHASFLPDESVHRAVLISDSCLTATSLAQGRTGRRPSGRLMFAPVRIVTEEESAAIAESDFERFALPASGKLAGSSVVEFRHCFAVDAVRLAGHVDKRILRCGPELALQLEERWNAYAVRRGPLVYERNTLKLAGLLSQSDELTVEHEALADAVADVLDCSLSLERDLEDVSDADEQVRYAGAEAGRLTPPLLDALHSRLRELASLATAAAEGIAKQR